MEGIKIICLNCGNEIVFPFGKYKRNDTDNFSILSYNGSKAVDIICENCDKEVILY